MTKNVGCYNYSYPGWDIGFNARSAFSLSSSGRFGKNIMIGWVKNGFSIQFINRKKDILDFVKVLTNGLDDTTIRIEILFKSTLKWTQEFLLVNRVVIFQFKAKDSKINSHPFCLNTIWKVFAVDSMNRTGIYGYGRIGFGGSLVTKYVSLNN